MNLSSDQFSATYSNLENHPRLIRAREPKPVPKIRLDPKTGLPSVESEHPAKLRGNIQPVEDSESDEEKSKRYFSHRRVELIFLSDADYDNSTARRIERG